MGYDITRFVCEVDEDLMCSICSGVLQEPLHAPQCEHAFCKSCISEWLTRQPSCPADRQRITPKQLRPAPRIVRNLLSRLMMKCDNAHFGCTAVVQLERLEAHIKEDCEHNPKRLVPCEKGCGLAIPKDELNDHNCFSEVRLLIQTQQDRVNEMQCTINKMQCCFNKMQCTINEMQCTINERQKKGKFKDRKRDIVSKKSCMQKYIPAVRLSNPSITAPLEVDDTRRWSNSLQRVRVTCWEAMSSIPCDFCVSFRVERALRASGCPAFIIVQLMGNAHETGWPTGLRTPETRCANRQYLENCL